ncbi:hypothetical protein NKL07_00725 [Mesorhizobium sp. C280B]|uniref:hypothetical protein n=1 Tax=unclassified Mesorhizobium TaxID=325217 RepID=UPI00333C0517
MMALRNRYQHHDRQKHNPLMAMVVHLLATDHGAVEYVECGKVRGPAVACSAGHVPTRRVLGVDAQINMKADAITQPVDKAQMIGQLKLLTVTGLKPTRDLQMMSSASPQRGDA